MKKAIIIFLSLIAAVAIAIVSVRVVGKYRLRSHSADGEMELPKITQNIEDIQTVQPLWKEGWVSYNGKIYEYNDAITTFLVMGIDKDTDALLVEEGTDGGQADALFLVVLDDAKETISIVGINRNAMSEVDIYNDKGEKIDSVIAQIAVQHGFGDGREKSCEYQVSAVRRLLYNLPIHGYVAINMSAIPTLNDAVGGVDVTALSDVKNGVTYDVLMKEGEQVHLMGETAYWYVRDRNELEFGTSDLRLSRQKQYIIEYINAAKRAIKANPGMALDLYREVTSQMVTNVTLDEIAYLTPEVIDYQFGDNSFYNIKGETVMGDEFEEFYPDEDELYDLIISLFYREVNLEE